VRAVAAAVTALIVCVIGMPSAMAHASQTGSTPEAGAVLEAAPSTVEVTFDSPLMDIGAALVVRAGDGTVISDPTPEVAGPRIRVDVPADAAPGTYTVAFRVVSQDGHPITATFDYTVAGDAPEPTAASAPVSPSATATATATATASASVPPSAEAVAAPEREESSGPPTALIVGGLLVLTLAVVGAIALRR
jgi:methionine-rich copper-binding protein CopC